MRVSPVLLFLGLLNPAHAVDEHDFSLIHPDQIDRCLKLPAAYGVEVTIDANPYYLRGDFDGDGKVDYAVKIRGSKTKRNGVLICTGNGRAFVLGADQPLSPPFSDMPSDNFVAPNWAAFSKAEVRELGKFNSNVPVPLPRLRGESIAMIWEDGTSLIYWDGRRFRWAGAKE